jgi:carboxylate-amine ligase
MHIHFNGSPGHTVGVEVELQVIDPETKNLVSGAPRILERVGDSSHVKPELIESTVELNTDVCTDVASVRAELSDRFRSLITLCDALGYELAATGTHPFSRWAEQEITHTERYHLLVNRCQWPARRLMIFGLHVHVGIESGEKAIAIFNALSGYIPHLLALSASSPYFEGEETGLASCRVKIFESLPTAGLPYRLHNWAEFERLMITLVNANAIESVREIWWDIRPHPDFGTVEVRICDGLSTLDDIIAMTAMIQALVVWLGDQYDEGRYLPLQPDWIVRENKWRAARWALDAEVIVDEDGRLEPLVESIDRLIESLEPVSGRLGSHDELMRLREIMKTGPSYARQRQVFANTGDFRQVVESVVSELRDSVPAATPVERYSGSAETVDQARQRP